MPSINYNQHGGSDTGDMFHIVFEHAPVAMILVMEDSTICNANIMFSHLSGYSKGEIEGKKKLGDFIATDNPDSLTDLIDLRQVPSETDPEQCEMTFIAYSGVISRKILTATNIPETTKRVISFVDSSSGKRAGETLNLREMQYANAMDLAHLVNWDLDVVSGMFHFDNRFYSLYRTTAAREGGTGMSTEDYIRNFVHPDDIPFVADIIKKSMDGEVTECRELEHRIIRRDGEIRFIIVRYKICSDEEGRVVGIYGANQDITEQKIAERKLRESEERYRTIFESIEDLYYQTDNRGIVTILSPSLYRLSGWKPEELIDKPVNQVYDSPEDRAKLLQEMEKTGYVRDYELTLRKRDGIPAITSISANRIYNEHGSPIGTAGIIRDITERKQIERALRLANKKLNLLSSITRHDINNQLAALHAFLYLSVEEINNPPRLTEYLKKEQIITNSIMQQIAFTANYESMGIHAPAWQNINEIIHKITEILSIQNIVENAVHPSLVIFADPMLEKVIFNIIDNALHYAGNQMTTIRIADQNEADHLVIRVMDDGIGISAEEKEEIFNKGVGRNTGLGLFLTREILSITDITIKETGIPGNGACFEITIPKGEYHYSE